MKRFYKPLLNSINRVSSGMMSLLGFGCFSCENATDAYGSPHTSFSSKCRVENTEELMLAEIPQYDIQSFPDYEETRIRAYSNEKEFTPYPTTPAFSAINVNKGRLISFDPDTHTYLKKENIQSAISWIQGKSETDVSMSMKMMSNE